METRKHQDGTQKLLLNAVRLPDAPPRDSDHDLMASSQQYHTALVFLYRPFIEYDNWSPHGTIRDPVESILENGITIARIFMQSSRQYDVRQSFVTAMQHAGVAVSALITSLAYVNDPERRYTAMRHLLFMYTILQELAYTYRHALDMHKVVATVLQQTEWENEYRTLEQKFKRDQESAPHIPARRGSCNIENKTDTQMMNKRRMVTPPRSSDQSLHIRGTTISGAPAADPVNESLNAFPRSVDTPATPNRDIQTTPEIVIQEDNVNH